MFDRRTFFDEFSFEDFWNICPICAFRVIRRSLEHKKWFVNRFWRKIRIFSFERSSSLVFLLIDRWTFLSFRFERENFIEETTLDDTSSPPTDISAVNSYNEVFLTWDNKSESIEFMSGVVRDHSSNPKRDEFRNILEYYRWISSCSDQFDVVVVFSSDSNWIFFHICRSIGNTWRLKIFQLNCQSN